LQNKIQDAANYFNIERNNISKAYKGCYWKFANINKKWHPLPYDELEPLYASSLGRIMRPNGRITEGSIKNDYHSTKVYEKYTRNMLSRRVHTLVAPAFLGCNDILFVNHKDVK
jgi:hypothetical protein